MTFFIFHHILERTFAFPPAPPPPADASPSFFFTFLSFFFPSLPPPPLALAATPSPATSRDPDAAVDGGGVVVDGRFAGRGTGTGAKISRGTTGGRTLHDGAISLTRCCTWLNLPRGSEAGRGGAGGGVWGGVGWAGTNDRKFRENSASGGSVIG